MSSEELKKQLLTQKLLRNLKNKQKSMKNTPNEHNTESGNKPQTSNVGRDNPNRKCDPDLTKRAIEEIQRDTLRASKLAEEVGPSGWRMKTKTTNKRFLANTMKSVLSHNERTKRKHATESKRKFEELSKRPPKFGSRLHSFQSTGERLTKRKDSNSQT